MTNRREFIHAGSLALGAIAGGIALADPQVRALRPSDEPLAVHTVIFDDRFQDSVLFAAGARRLGLSTSNLDSGDATRVWYDNLYHRWKEGPAAIAGLTTPQTLFVLETLGNDAGLRLRFKAEHRILENRVEHRLSGPAEMLRTARSLEVGGMAWGSHMSRIIGSAAKDHAGRIEDTRVTDLSMNDPAQRNFLVTWLLAPRMPLAAASFTAA